MYLHKSAIMKEKRLTRIRVVPCLSSELQLEPEMHEFRLSMAVALLQSEARPPLFQLTPPKSDQQLFCGAGKVSLIWPAHVT